MPHALSAPPEVNALGFFQLRVGGTLFGIRNHTATWLHTVYNQLRFRIECRGTHCAPFACDASAEMIAEALRVSGYCMFPTRSEYFGIELDELYSLFATNRLHWSVYCDESFDDGSQILHFDVSDRVRIVAFRSLPEPQNFDRDSVREAWLPADTFYSLLGEWCDHVFAAWQAAPKVDPDQIDW